MSNMVWRAILASIMALVMKSVACAELLAQEYYTDPKTKEPLGTRDLITTGVDLRVAQTPSYGSKMEIKFDSSEPLSLEIGSGVWGSIQTSAFVADKPFGAVFSSPFCRVTSQDMTYHYSYSMGIGNGSKIVDYESNNDLVFLLTADKSIASTKVLLHNDVVLSTQWVSNALASMIGDVFTGDAINVGLGYDKNTGYLYVPSANGLFRIAQSNQAVAKVADGVFQPFGDIVYTDCTKGVLVVAYRNQGVFVYDVSNPASITLIKKFDRDFFQANVADKTTLQFTFFVIQSHLVQVASNDKIETNPLYDILSTNPKDYTSVLDAQSMAIDLLVVSTNQGVLFVDVTQMLSAPRTPPTSALPRRLNFNYTVQMARFQNTLIILEQDPNRKLPGGDGSEFSKPVSTITEILLTANEASQWANTNVPSNQIFYVNRRADLANKIKSVFADAQYMYLISENSVSVYNRGIQSQYDEVILNIGKQIHETSIYGVVSIAHNKSKDLGLLTFGDIRMAAYNLSFSESKLVCGADDQKAIPGNYRILLNATTRDCPRKSPSDSSSSAMTFRDRVLSPCNWQVEILVTASNVWISLPKTSSGMVVMLVAAVVFFLILAAVVCLFFRNKTLQNEKRGLQRIIDESANTPTSEGHFFRQKSLGSPTTPVDGVDPIKSGELQKNPVLTTEGI